MWCWRRISVCKSRFCLKPVYSDSTRRQLSNGTRLRSRLYRTRKLWASKVWGYCRVLQPPPAPRAFFPLPPVLPHACRTAVRHVHAWHPALTVLVSIGLHELWHEWGLRAQPCRVSVAPHSGTPALQCPWLHGPLAPVIRPWRGYVWGEWEVCIWYTGISMLGPALAGWEGQGLLDGAAVACQWCRTFPHP